MPFKINEKCIQCGECVDQCPVDAIDKLVTEVFHIHQDICCDCKACLDVCKKGAIEYNEDYW